MLAIFATAGHLSVTSFAIAPLNIVPLGFPLSSFKTTAALSSNFILVPSALLYSFFCLTIIACTTCFLMSGLPRLTEAMTKSATPAEEMRPFVVFKPTTVNILSTLAPELSQVSTSLPTGSALVTLAFIAFILSAPLLLSLHYPYYLQIFLLPSLPSTLPQLPSSAQILFPCLKPQPQRSFWSCLMAGIPLSLQCHLH